MHGHTNLKSHKLGTNRLGCQHLCHAAIDAVDIDLLPSQSEPDQQSGARCCWCGEDKGQL